LFGGEKTGSLHSPSYSTGKGPQHAAVIVSSLIIGCIPWPVRLLLVVP
jgi:hypothetical protein